MRTESVTEEWGRGVVSVSTLCKSWKGDGLGGLGRSGIRTNGVGDLETYGKRWKNVRKVLPGSRKTSLGLPSKSDPRGRDGVTEGA